MRHYLIKNLKNKYSSSLYLIIVLIITYGVFSPILNNWWAMDDMHGLISVINNEPKDYLFSSNFYNGNKVIFTPIGLLIFELFYQWQGLDPTWFYVYHLFVVLGVVSLTYYYLRLWINIYWSILGAILFALSGPFLIVGYELQCVQYLHGLLFIICSLYLYESGRRSGRRLWSHIGAIFFLLACLSKEIYVPVLMAIPFISKGDLRNQLKHWYPYLLILIIYIIWRYSILDLFVLGYGVSANPFQILTLPFRITSYISGGGLIGIGFLMVFAGAIFLYLFRNRSRIFFFTIASGILVFPILFVAFRIHSIDRSLILFSWALNCGTVAMASYIYQRTIWEKIISVFLIITLLVGLVSILSNERNRLIHTNKQFRTVGKFILNSNQNDILLLQDDNFRSQEAKEVKEKLYGPSFPTVLFDPVQFDMVNDTNSRYFVFDEDLSKMLKVEKHDILEKWNTRIVERPISVHLEKNGPYVNWNFGPYKNSGYSVILTSAPSAFTRTRYTGRYTAILPPMEFILRYKSKEGWVTYSEKLIWKNEDGEVLDWKRE